MILLYLESFGNPRRFARIARGTSQSKPIVVVKAGRATAPEATGPVAADLVSGDAPVNALFRQTGVIRAETLDEMFDLAAALDRQPLPAGRRVAILSDGGGPGILCADACRRGAAVGASAVRFDEETAGGLPLGPRRRSTIPWSCLSPPSADPYARAIESLLLADEVDSLIAIHTPLDANDSAAMLEAIRQGTTAGRAAGGAGKPVLACLVAKDDAGTPMVLAGESIPTYAFPESAARVLGKVAAYAEWRAGPHGVIPDFDDIDLDSAREHLPEGDRGTRGRLALGGRGDERSSARCAFPSPEGSHGPRPTKGRARRSRCPERNVEVKVACSRIPRSGRSSLRARRDPVEVDRGRGRAA